MPVVVEHPLDQHAAFAVPNQVYIAQRIVDGRIEVVGSGGGTLPDIVREVVQEEADEPVAVAPVVVATAKEVETVVAAPVDETVVCRVEAVVHLPAGEDEATLGIVVHAVVSDHLQLQGGPGEDLHGVVPELVVPVGAGGVAIDWNIRIEWNIRLAQLRSQPACEEEHDFLLVAAPDAIGDVAVEKGLDRRVHVLELFHGQGVHVAGHGVAPVGWAEKRRARLQLYR